MHIFLNATLSSSSSFSFSSLPGHMKGDSGEAYLKEKQGSPWGSRIKKGKKRKGERMEVQGEEGGCSGWRQTVRRRQGEEE